MFNVECGKSDFFKTRYVFCSFERKNNRLLFLIQVFLPQRNAIICALFLLEQSLETKIRKMVPLRNSGACHFCGKKKDWTLICLWRIDLKRNSVWILPKKAIKKQIENLDAVDIERWRKNKTKQQQQQQEPTIYKQQITTYFYF